MKTIGRRDRLLRDPMVFTRAFRRDRLMEGWTKVWENAGAAGGDGLAVGEFARGAVQRVAELQRELDEGSYVPGPVRRVMMPKKSGGQRPLDIPCVRDRVAQTALANTLGPLLEEEFEDASFGYRPGRSVQQAVRRVEFLRRQGMVHVVDADVTRFFENVRHESLMERLAESMTEGPTSLFISQWLEHSAADGRGLAQGSPLSPLLANLYLDRLDEAFADSGARIIRFADDFLILCHTEKGAADAMAKTERLLARQGLELNREKTRIIDFEAGFRFLGHVFVQSFAIPDPDSAMTDVSQVLRSQAARDEEQTQRDKQALEEAALARRARLDPGQRVLYLMRGGRRLSTRNAGFLVEEDVLGETAAGTSRGQEWRDLLLLHPGDVDRIEIGPQANVTEEALRQALGTETEIAFVNGLGETQGWLTRGHDGRARRQLAQAAAALDPARKLEIATSFVDGRIRNERALLRRLNRSRADGQVINALAELNALIRRLPHCLDLSVLRGLEGRAAALYWPAFGCLLDHGFSFSRRERERGAGAVNIMLNMTASLLARDISIAMVRAGLHTGFGFLHEARDNGEAAVYDLMEEFRAPLAEATVSSAINQRVVDIAMFAPAPGSSETRMGREAQTAIIRCYQRFAEREVKDPLTGRRRSWRALMTDQAIRLAQAIEGGGDYQPIVIDY